MGSQICVTLPLVSTRTISLLLSNNRFPSANNIERIQTPLLFIDAQNDTVIYPSMVNPAQIYGTTTEIFPDMVHDIMLEAGWEKIAKRILDWLD